MSASELVDALRARGVTLSVANGRLEVRPASALTDPDRALIRVHVTDLLAALNPTTGEPWNAAVARRLMYDADTLVGQLGVDGRHPEVTNAAARAVNVSATRDLPALRLAVARFGAIVRRIACERGNGAGCSTCRRK